MKRYIYIVISILFIINIFAQKQQSKSLVKPLVNSKLVNAKKLIEEAHSAMLNYDFNKAYSLYLKASESTDSIISKESVIGVQRASKAKSMLDAVQDIAIIDSIVVPKKNFFEHYNLSSSAGYIFSLDKNCKKSNMQPTGYETSRNDRMIIADSLAGKYDLFYSNKLLDGWSERRSFSSVLNTTSYNENYPFLLADGQTLYYCSDGPGSIGGYDIFISRPDGDTGNYYPPENIGMPFNSPFNDYLMAIDEEKNIGFFASDRYQSPDSLIIYNFVPNYEHTIIKYNDIADKIAYATLKRHNGKSLISLHTDSSTIVLDSLLLSPIKKDTLENLNNVKIMNFTIKDDIIYHSINDFKSTEAKNFYKQGLEFEEKKMQQQLSLEQKRKQYALETDKNKKNQLANDIKNIENWFFHIPKTNNYFKQCRNWEIRNLKSVILKK